MLTFAPEARLCIRGRAAGKPAAALRVAAALAIAAALSLGSCGDDGAEPAASRAASANGAQSSAQSGAPTDAPTGDASGNAAAPDQAPAAPQALALPGAPASPEAGVQAAGAQAAGTGSAGQAGQAATTISASGGDFPSDAPAAAAGDSRAGGAAGGATGAAAGVAERAPAGAQAPQAAAPARRLGELVYTEGTVTVHRSGGVKERVDIGDTVRQYEVIATGPGSRATIDLAAGYPGGAELKLAENTAFYFDVKAPEGEERRSVIQLLAGALAIKVDKLAGGSFNVAADGAVLGVRGTVFIVDTVPDGSLLVTTNEGAVEVRSLDGRRATSRADAAVAVPAGGSTRLLPVEPAKAADFRVGWRNEAVAAFAPRALETAATYAKAIDDHRAAFNAALRGLGAHDATLKLWRDARAADRVPRFTDWIDEKKALAGPLFDCLKALFMIERPYYRLLELKSYHDERGIGVGELRDGRSSAAFYAGFEAANAALAADMARVREALDLFGYAAAGSPLGELFGSKAAGLGSGAALLGDDW